jgi:16S rRNA (cytidine1402-2'-O)-methyltransferase
MATLYIVATPIGNLEDITLRALRVLAEVSLIAAEDTRVTRRLLSRYDITTQLTSYHEHNARVRLPVLLKRLEDEDIALVCDAGTPAVNDPGQELVSAAACQGIEVVAIPGASALTAAIAVSGIPISGGLGDGFVYLGFLPRRTGERQRLFDSLVSERRALVAFEAPHRLRASLRDLLAHLGDRRIGVCRELTKLHEEVFRGTVSEAVAHFDQPRGEFTLVIEGVIEGEIEGAGPQAQAEPAVDPRELLGDFRRRGTSARDAVALASEATGMGRRELYSMWLELPDSPD